MRQDLRIGFKTNKTRTNAAVAAAVALMGARIRIRGRGAFCSLAPLLRGEGWGEGRGFSACSDLRRGPLTRPHLTPPPPAGEGRVGATSPRKRGEVKAARPSSVIPALMAFTFAGLAGAAQAEGDAAKGKAAFVRQCAICHTSEKGGDNRFGPNLFGIIGKKAGTVPDYAYTNAFKTRANWEWSEDAIGGWMMFPSTMVPGTAMGVFQGIAEKDRDDLVAYLATLK